MCIAGYLWEPRKNLDPSPPRRRGSSLIKDMDSRLRGNDKFFEVPLCTSLGMGCWMLMMLLTPGKIVLNG